MGTLGIVGHEAAKFTPSTKESARRAIRFAISRYAPDLVVSGACHLGGVDVWAIEEARHAGIPVKEFPPKVLSWGLPGGFRDRNMQIAEASDAVMVFVVRRLPEGYEGMTFPVCYHCARHRKHYENLQHVKSGACWTAWKAVDLGKKAEWTVI